MFTSFWTADAAQGERATSDDFTPRGPKWSKFDQPVAGFHFGVNKMGIKILAGGIPSD
jgi:hypothetical protein